MIKITFIEPNGHARIVEAAPNGSLMQLALNEGVSGVLGDCGGTCGCGTCQVHLQDGWITELPPAADDEADMLSLSEYLTPASRLACQIALSPALDGLVVKVPEIQG